jgi:hypothetical protein
MIGQDQIQRDIFLFLFNCQNNLEGDPSESEAVLEITLPSAPNLIPPEEEALPPEFEAGRKKTVKFDTSSSETSGQATADYKATRMQHKLQNLDDAWNPVIRDTMNKATVIESDESCNEVAKEIHFVFNVELHNDDDMPEDYKTAMQKAKTETNGNLQ